MSEIDFEICNFNFKSIASATNNFKRPALINGYTDNWPARKLWSEGYFINKYGNAEISVYVSRPVDGKYTGNPADGSAGRCPMTILEYFVNRKECPPGIKLFYWQQQPLEGEFSDLNNDVIAPYFMEQDPGVPHLWMSSSGTVTPLHFDSDDNFFAQVKGKKKVTLFDPGQGNLFYSNPEGTKYAHVSMVDPERPCYSKFPNFKNAYPISLVLEEGDLLFIPRGWWHHVRSLTDSISLNFWYAKGRIQRQFELICANYTEE